MKKAVISFVFILSSGYLIAQGCSDAGFCSLSVLKNNTQTSKLKNSISIGVNYGNGEQSTSTINHYKLYFLNLLEPKNQFTFFLLWV